MHREEHCDCSSRQFCVFLFVPSFYPNQISVLRSNARVLLIAKCIPANQALESAQQPVIVLPARIVWPILTTMAHVTTEEHVKVCCACCRPLALWISLSAALPTSFFTPWCVSSPVLLDLPLWKFFSPLRFLFRFLNWILFGPSSWCCLLSALFIPWTESASESGWIFSFQVKLIHELTTATHL